MVEQREGPDTEDRKKGESRLFLDGSLRKKTARFPSSKDLSKAYNKRKRTCSLGIESPSSFNCRLREARVAIPFDAISLASSSDDAAHSPSSVFFSFSFFISLHFSRFSIRRTRRNRIDNEI